MEAENRVLREQLKRAIEVFTPQAPSDPRESIQHALVTARAQLVEIEKSDSPELEYDAIQLGATIHALERKRDQWVDYDAALQFLQDMASDVHEDAYLETIKKLSISTRYLFNYAVIQSEPNSELQYDANTFLKKWERALRRSGPVLSAAELARDIPVVADDASKSLQIWTTFLQTLSDAVQRATQYGDANARADAAKKRVDDYFAEAERKHGKTLTDMLHYVLRKKNVVFNASESIERLKKAFRVHVLNMGFVDAPFPSPAVVAFFVSVGDLNLKNRREVWKRFLKLVNSQPVVVDLVTPPASPPAASPVRKRHHKQQQPQPTLDERIAALETQADSVLAEKQDLEVVMIDMVEGADNDAAMMHKSNLISQYRALLQQLRALKQQKNEQEDILRAQLRKQEVDDLKVQLRALAADKQALDREMRNLIDDAEVDAATRRYDELEEQTKQLMAQLNRLQRRDNPMPPQNKKMARRIK